MYSRPRRIAAKPTCEIVERLSRREYRGEAYQPPVARIRSTQKALDQHFIPNFPCAEANHVAFIQYNQTDLI